LGRCNPSDQQQLLLLPLLPLLLLPPLPLQLRRLPPW
jgi:hypothetical protein